MLLAIIVSVGALLFVMVSMARSVRNERSGRRSIWWEFSLGFALMILFFVTWIAHGITEWQTYTDEQRQHGESTKAGDFVAEFAQSTLENWQSEFLQLFAFVSLAALYIHKGSPQSKDGEEKMEASLHRIEQHLGTLPLSKSNGSNGWKLPDTALQLEDERQEH